mgnify:CR=1 FL=1
MVLDAVFYAFSKGSNKFYQNLLYLKLRSDCPKISSFRRNQFFGHNFRAGISGKKLFIYQIDIGILVIW